MGDTFYHNYFQYPNTKKKFSFNTRNLFSSLKPEIDTKKYFFFKTKITKYTPMFNWNIAFAHS